MTRRVVDADRLRARAIELFEYDDLTGNLICKQDRGRRRVGEVAGYTDDRGYTRVGIDDLLYYAHQIVWLLCKGWFAEKLDHRDENKSNNRIGNLREATSVQNSGNITSFSHNTSGIRGVSQIRSTEKFRVYITVAGKAKHVGVYDSLEEAAAVRRAAEKELYGEFTAGSRA